MLDFIALFVEGLLFFVLALMTGSREMFYSFLAGLFVFDALWVGSTNLTALREEDRVPQYYRWASINVLAAMALLVFTWSNLLNWEFWPSDLSKNIALCAVAVLRTIYDYKSVWHFYYPRAQDRLYERLIAPRPAPPPQLVAAPVDEETSA